MIFDVLISKGKKGSQLLRQGLLALPKEEKRGQRGSQAWSHRLRKARKLAASC